MCDCVQARHHRSVMIRGKAARALVHRASLAEYGELRRRSGMDIIRLTTVQRNARRRPWQSLQENWDQESQLHVPPSNCRTRAVRGILQGAGTDSYRTVQEWPSFPTRPFATRNM